MQLINTTVTNAHGQSINPIFATQPKPSVSAKYKFCSTKDIVTCLEQDGWVVHKTQINRCRADKVGYQKHQVTLGHPRYENSLDTPTLGQIRPRLVLVNEHSGSGAVTMQLGLFRLVCLNGLMVPDSQVQKIRFTHQGKDDLTIKVLAAAYQLLHAYDTKVKMQVERLSSIVLTPEQQAEFAGKAAAIVWPDGSRTTIKNTGMLTYSRRLADDNTDLWTIFNRVQENVMQGGLLNSNGRRTRAIKSIDRETQVNVQLMQLALDYSQVVAN